MVTKSAYQMSRIDHRLSDTVDSWVDSAMVIVIFLLAVAIVADGTAAA